MKTLKLYKVTGSLKTLTLDLLVAADSAAQAKSQARNYYRTAKRIGAKQVGVVNVPIA